MATADHDDVELLGMQHGLCAGAVQASRVKKWVNFRRVAKVPGMKDSALALALSARYPIIAGLAERARAQVLAHETQAVSLPAGTVGVRGWIGAVPLATAAFSVCLSYSVLGVNTCLLKKA